MRYSSIVSRATSLSMPKNLVVRRTFSTNAKESANQGAHPEVQGQLKRRVGQTFFCVWLATCFYLPVMNFRYHQSKI